MFITDSEVVGDGRVGVMSHTEIPYFPRGFLLSQRPVEPPPTFVKGPLLPNFYVHPWTNVEVAGNKDLFVIVIGHCVRTRHDQLAPAVNYLLASLRRGEEEFLRSLDAYSGRHAILFGSADNIRVVNDASAMRSVFYSTDGSVVASHAILVERALGGEIVQSELPFRYGYPGIRTPYLRTRLLTANTYFSMKDNEVRRFWPIAALKPRTVEEAAVELLDSSTHALRSMASGRTVGLAISSGLDSRASLAIAYHSGIPFSAYTYGGGPGTVVERTVASQLSEKLGFDHTVIPSWVKDPTLKERILDGHYSPHIEWWVGALREYYQDEHALAVLGNNLEIGRGNFMVSRQQGHDEPTSARKMAVLHHSLFGSKMTEPIERYGVDRFWQESEELFQEYIDVTGLEVGLLNPFDQFYWEHRITAWQGVAMGERDFYAVPFVPFNSRHVFETMLGVPDEQRYADEAVYRMIEMVNPALLEVPVNPKRSELHISDEELDVRVPQRR